MTVMRSFRSCRNLASSGLRGRRVVEEGQSPKEHMGVVRDDSERYYLVETGSDRTGSGARDLLPDQQQPT